MSEAQTQRQVIVQEPWWLGGIKWVLKWIAILFALGLDLAGLYYIGQAYSLAGFFVWIVPSTIMIYLLIRVAGPKVVAVDLEKRTAKFAKIPWPIWREFSKEGEVVASFSDDKGDPVYFAEELDLDAKRVKFAWVHSLSAIEYVMSASAFLKLREDFRDKVLRLAELELTFSEQLAKVSEGAIARQVRSLLGKEVEEEVRRVLERLRRMRGWEVVPYGKAGGGQEAQRA